jgi:hypothetical protein
MGGFKVIKNLAGNKQYLRVSLDGYQSKENKLKKAIKGHTGWKISEPVGTSPKVRFEFSDPKKIGHITDTVITIHREFNGEYSHHAEFTVLPRDGSPASQLKAGQLYDLAKPPANIKVIDLRANEVSRVQLAPGVKYKLQLSIAADHSETAVVFFKTS